MSVVQKVCRRSAEYRGPWTFQEKKLRIIEFSKLSKEFDIFLSLFQCLCHRALMFCYIGFENPSTTSLCTIHMYCMRKCYFYFVVVSFFLRGGGQVCEMDNQQKSLKGSVEKKVCEPLTYVIIVTYDNSKMKYCRFGIFQKRLLPFSKI